MNKGDAKKQALRWLDEATLNGQEAGAELTADYLDKFNFFLDNVLTFVASTFKLDRIATFSLNEIETKGNFYRLVLPEDFMELNRIDRFNATSYNSVSTYRKERNGVYLVPKALFSESDTIEVLYYGMPQKLGTIAPDSSVIEVLPKAEQLVPLRLAIEATAGSDETSGISAYLEGKYSNMVANLLGEGTNDFGFNVERVFAQ